MASDGLAAKSFEGDCTCRLSKSSLPDTLFVSEGDYTFSKSWLLDELFMSEGDYTCCSVFEDDGTCCLRKSWRWYTLGEPSGELRRAQTWHMLGELSGQPR